MRKRRELSDLVTGQWTKVYRPHQSLSLDDVIEPNKHQQAVRCKFKASVHSGTMGDGLADCNTHYMLDYKPKYWDEPEIMNNERQRRASDKANTTTTKKLLQPHGGKGHVVFLDRGYGHVQLQKELLAMGIHSTSMMQCNRKGLPRELLQQLEQALEKWDWCLLHRDGWELQVWQDSKLCICLTCCHTGPTVGFLGRGADGSEVVWRVWTPQGDAPPALVVAVYLDDLQICGNKGEWVHAFKGQLVQCIEFQKRGLPHNHTLLGLGKACNPKTTLALDFIVFAEQPDPTTHPPAAQLGGPTHVAWAVPHALGHPCQ